jgi:hypothetical protein
LLQFLKDYHLVSVGRFEAISHDIQARIQAKTGNFESFLGQWHRKTCEEAFERDLVHAVEDVESMQRNKEEAEKRRAEVRERSREVREDIERTARWHEGEEERRARRPKIDHELRNRSPERLDLRRLVPEERAFVHAIKQEANKGRAINWRTLQTEVFFNELTLKDYMDLADIQGEIEAEQELEEDYVTPLELPIRTE